MTAISALTVLTATGVVALGPSVATANPSSATEPTAETTAAAPTRYNGAELLTGLAFGLGPVADRYPDLVLSDLPDKPELTAALGALTADIDGQNPGFLNRFATAMYSGKHIDIQDVAEQAGMLLKDAAQKRYPPSAATTNGDGQGQCLVLNVALAVNVALVLNLAVHINVAVSQAVAVHDTVAFEVNYIASDKPIGSALPMEHWVAGIAKTLSKV